VLLDCLSDVLTLANVLLLELGLQAVDFVPVFIQLSLGCSEFFQAAVVLLLEVVAVCFQLLYLRCGSLATCR
jgi:hypothetical protein